MKSLLVIFLLSLCFNAQASRELTDFTSDGCSAYPDGYPFTGRNEWLHCCFAHDIKYWVGGSQELKAQADEELNQCVAESTFGAHGRMMKMGVATGGTPHIKTRWRWGYGWVQMEGYKSKSLDESTQVRQMAFTILNELTLQSHYFDMDQIDYIFDAYTEFVQTIDTRIDSYRANPHLD